MGTDSDSNQQSFNANQLQADVTQASSSTMSTSSSPSSSGMTGSSSSAMPQATGSVGAMDNAMRRNVTLVFTPAVPAVNVVELGTASTDGSSGGDADSEMTNDQSTMLPSSLSWSTTSSSLPATTLSSDSSMPSMTTSSFTAAMTASTGV